MMRSRFDQQLTLLNQELIAMGALCEEAIDLAASSLMKGDSGQTEKIRSLGEEIDQMEREIETRCLKLLLQQQPVARDLRQISAALKMVTDMERIGDQATDIGEIIGFMKGRTVSDFDYIDQMAEATIHMVTQSVNAYVKRDVELARSVVDYDDVVDDFFLKVKTALIQLIGQRPEDGEFAIDLLMIAKYFEKIGDHAVNVAQWVVFSVTGIHKEAKD